MKEINTIFQDVFKISEEQAQENKTMADVATWDSLSHMDLIVAIEDKFGIRLSGEDIAEMVCFNAIRTTVTKHLD